LSMMSSQTNCGKYIVPDIEPAIKIRQLYGRTHVHMLATRLYNTDRLGELKFEGLPLFRRLSCHKGQVMGQDSFCDNFVCLGSTPR